MHAIVIDVSLDTTREPMARQMLDEVIVPKAKSHSGFAAGYWLRALEADVIRSLHLYDSEPAARQAAEAIRSQGAPPDAPVRLTSVDIYEGVAEA